MDQAEVAEIMSATSRHATGLLALADGWPAVIGLAASSPKTPLPEAVPEPLYDFFAQELLNALPEESQRAIEQLAAAPWIDRELATAALADSADETLARSEQIGILAREAGDRFAIHPLLRAFLIERLTARGENIGGLLSRLVHFYRAEADWDAAFSVVELSEDDALLCGLLNAALPVYLTSGRIRTLSRWLETARRWQTQSPILDLAAAEIAYREGDGIGARAVAEHALGTIGPSEALKGQLLLVAGKAALLLHDTQQAMMYMNAAQSSRLTEEQKYEAAWVRFLAAARLEASDAHKLLADLVAMSQRIPERQLRAMSGEWVLAVRTGPIHHLLERFQALARLAPRAADPVARSAFLISRVHLLVVLGHYNDALSAVDALEAEARDFRLEFAMPHISMAKAFVHLGLRQFSQAASLVAYTERIGVERRDVFVQMNSAALRGRLLLYQGLPAEAVGHLTEHWPVLPERSLHAEYLAVRALALIANGSVAEAHKQCERVEGMSSGIEAAVLRMAASAMIELRRQSAGAPKAIGDLVECALHTGNHDGFLFACRVFPELASAVGENLNYRPRLAGVVRRAHDAILARQWHLPVPPRTSADCLTPREREVYELLALGRTNREIAAALFISEPTAKVHTLHILEKLGLRSRTEAALHASDARHDHAAATAASTPHGS
jgi:ATP/maltotriose-dependent transcriptional regulator MalT